MSTYKPFEEILKDIKIEKRRCPHKWNKNNNIIKCDVCSATGFYDKEKDKIFMKKNSQNNKISIINNDLFEKHFKEAI